MAGPYGSAHRDGGRGGSRRGSSWSIIGSVVGGAAFALTLAKAIGVWGKVLEAHTTAWNAAQGLVGAMAGYLGGIEDLNVHALPTASYDHPGV